MKKLPINNYFHFSFDLWLTIIKSNPEFKGKRDLLLKDFFNISKPIEEVQQQIRYYDLLFNKISENTGLHIEREVAFSIILSALGMDLQDITEDHFKGFFQRVDALFLANRPVLIWENLQEELHQLKKAGKTASILSNTAFIYGDSLENVLHHLGLKDCFSFMIFSDVVKISKPNPKIFELVHNLVQEIKPLKKKEILHIGDNNTADYKGAQSFGFSAELVKF